jgi:hypothetical protein
MADTPHPHRLTPLLGCLQTALVAALPALLHCGTQAPEPGATDPPLRPLLYTEAPAPAERVPLPGMEMWQAADLDPVAWPTELPTTVRSMPSTGLHEPPRTPDALLLAALDALLRDDTQALAALTFDVDTFAAAARTSTRDAERQVEELVQTLTQTRLLFQAPPPSQARAEGLRGLLEPGQVTLGRGRLHSGAVATADQVAVMHWGNEVVMHHRDLPVSFVIRFPKVLVDSEGVWRLAAAPVADAAFRMFRTLGLDLKPELLNATQGGLPLNTGNFWHYRVERPREESGSTTELRLGFASEGFRDEIIGMDDRGAYRLVRFRRLFDDPTRTSQTFAWLQTPLRIYACNRECQRRSRDVSWLLTHAQNQVPLLVLPPPAGGGWGAGGTERTDPVWRVAPETEAVDVPAGHFPATRRLSRSVPGGQQVVHFAPGIGFVQRSTIAGLRTEDERLSDYRIMP